MALDKFLKISIPIVRCLFKYLVTPAKAGVRRWIPAFAGMTLVLLLASCPGSTDGDSIPVDRFYYPSSLAKNGNTLYVANANLDLQYRNGSVLQIDTTTGKVTRSWLIPSLAGEFAHDAAFSELWITAQGKPVLMELISEKTLELPQQQPYFLTLASGTQGGLLGYLYRTDNILSSQSSLIKDFAELQYFEQSGIKQSLRLANCIGDKTDRLRISRIGGVQNVGGNVYALAEMIIKPDTTPQKHVFLIKAPIAKLGDCSATDLTETLRENAVGARGIVLSADAQKAYVLLDENPSLSIINLGEKLAVSNSVTTCKAPGKMKMNQAGDTLFVLCPRTNQVLAYDSASLALLGEVQTALDMTRQGLSPLDMVIDGNELWVSYQNSHQIGILKYENSSSARTLSFVRWFELSR